MGVFAAKRRHHEERIKRKVRSYFNAKWALGEPFEAEVIGKVARTRHRCSGYCCGNPRKWFGAITPQEQRQRDIEREAV